MKCYKIIKENNNVYMINENGVRLDLENDFDIQKYERANSVNVLKLVNDYIGEKDSNFIDIINNIENLVQKYNIDYYMLGNGKDVSKDSLALVYNLKNRESCVDCILKVFYQEECKSLPAVKCMVEFSDGSCGKDFGFSFYKFFDLSSFHEIHQLLEEYFSSDSTGDKDQRVINICIRNIQNRLKNYYAE